MPNCIREMHKKGTNHLRVINLSRMDSTTISSWFSVESLDIKQIVQECTYRNIKGKSLKCTRLVYSAQEVNLVTFCLCRVLNRILNRNYNNPLPRRRKILKVKKCINQTSRIVAYWMDKILIAEFLISACPGAFLFWKKKLTAEMSKFSWEHDRRGEWSLG